jgi:hypothetical protein
MPRGIEVEVRYSNFDLIGFKLDWVVVEAQLTPGVVVSPFDPGENRESQNFTRGPTPGDQDALL